jgi:hypothetical protein
MKIKFYTVAIMASIITLMGCQPANAVPLDVTLGYQDNKAIGTDGLRLDVGTEVNNFRFGLTTFSSDEQVESYGAYAAVPLYLQNTKFAITPQVRIEEYRTPRIMMASVGLGLEYALTETVRFDAVALVNHSLKGSGDTTETYMAGITKTFK